MTSSAWTIATGGSRRSPNSSRGRLGDTFGRGTCHPTTWRSTDRLSRAYGVDRYWGCRRPRLLRRSRRPRVVRLDLTLENWVRFAGSPALSSASVFTQSQIEYDSCPTHRRSPAQSWRARRASGGCCGHRRSPAGACDRSGSDGRVMPMRVPKTRMGPRPWESHQGLLRRLQSTRTAHTKHRGLRREVAGGRIWSAPSGDP